MTGTHAELSSLATALEDITTRVTAIADDHVGTDREDLAVELYEIERLLAQAQRRLSRMVRVRR